MRSTNGTPRLTTALALAASLAAPAAHAEAPIVVAGVGLATPESVEYDATHDVYLVTNVNGSPFDADGNGFISRIAPDGRVLALKWIDGARDGVTLNGPTGAAAEGENLFLADRDAVRVFALADGHPVRSIPIPGATFLNGITPAGGDSVYVSDSGFLPGSRASGSDAIYRVWADGRYAVVVKAPDLGHPNGLVDTDAGLVVVTFGSGEVFRLDATGRRTPLPAPPHGGLDGVVRLADGRLLISSWKGSAVYALGPRRTVSVLADGLDAPADLGLDTRRNRLLIPLFRDNRVVILPLAGSSAR